MKSRLKLIMLTFLLVVISCTTKNPPSENDYTILVDPMIGTDWNGHTFPGATLPNGMVQLSPDTKTQTWNNCSGYHYADKSILGFSHTHYSGTGEGGGSDILFMPTTGEIHFRSGEDFNIYDDDYTSTSSADRKNEAIDTKDVYGSKFSHDNETSSPGYYSVLLDDYNVKVELTTTKRAGFHKYTFPESKEANVILDLVSGNSDKPDSLYVSVDGDEISGYRSATGALDGEKTIYFVARFSKPVASYGLAVNDEIQNGKTSVKAKNVKAYFRFETKKDEAILLKVAISSVDIEGARKNLIAELPGWDFERTRKEAKDSWNKELSKIDVEGGTKEQQVVFYTALYHALIHPNINMDVDRRYRSTNAKIYKADDFDNYTTFSLWDTFRGEHPLQTIINTAKTNQYIRTFIKRYQHTGTMPLMEFSGNEASTMIGYHSLPVIADAYVKGIRDYDVKKAYAGMKELANAERAGKEYYLQYGFIPYDLKGQSVSRTLEYSFDDWCVGRLAKDFNKEDFEYYNQRGQFYRNLFDKETGFMRPKNSEYQWLKDFNPMEISNRYTEANAYQYTPSVFQDIEGLIRLMGGEEKFEHWLDNDFATEMDTTLLHLPDVTGLIGQYAHGNEPSHHVAYLYNYVGAAWKTQQRIRQILTTLYSAKPDGISGNEDAGQMSAWYVLSAMGFYPVTPGMDYYVIGSPLFDKVTIHLENGKQFKIEAKNNSSAHPYIQSATLNGKEYSASLLRHKDIVNGSELIFEMGEEPNKEWGKKKMNRPYSIKYHSASMARIETTGNKFLDSTQISLFCADKNAVIRYTLDGRDPEITSQIYTKPFRVKETSVLKVRCFVKSVHPGYILSIDLQKIELTPALNIKNLRPGLEYVYKEGFCKKIADMKKYPVKEKGIIKSFNLNAVKDARPFGYRFEGYINVPVDGLYTFYLEANDGAILYIDGKELINNDGGHQSQNLGGKTGLKKGFHPIRVDYFQMGRAKKLLVQWEHKNFKVEEIPSKVLYHKKE